MRPPPFRFRLGYAWFIVVIAGLGVGVWSAWRERDRRLADLKVDAHRCALAFRSEELAQLTGTRVDIAHPLYGAIKHRLVELHSVHPDVRFVSIFRADSQSDKVIYLADSEPSESKELSSPGDVFPEAAKMPGLQSILRDGRPAIEGPIEDSFGVFVTGYAQIGPNRRNPAGGDVREVVVLDVTARTWNGELIDAGLKAALYCWLLLGIPVGIVAFQRRQSRRDALIGKLSHAVEQSQSGILIASAEGRIEYVNTGFCAQFGYAERDLIGRRCSELAGDLPPELVTELVKRLTAGQSWEGEWQNRRRHGQTFPAQAVVTPVKTDRDQILGYIAVLSDLTAQHRHQEELRSAKERAEAGDRAKGEFLATMSHEVRTPLNGIVGFTNLLLETPLTPEQREYVNTIRTSGEALVQLAGDILDYSKIESGGLQLDASICDVRAAVEDALDIFAASAGEKGVELLHNIDVDVPEQLLLDAGRLRQILVNLIGNGIKFTSKGCVEVTVRNLTARGSSLAPFDPSVLSGQIVAELDDGSLTLEFSVRDTGIGIAEEDRPKLFLPFTQLDISTVRRYGGAGLGLAISRNLARLMGGDIWIDSTPGRGSTFSFTVRGRRAPEEIEVSTACDLAQCRIAIAAESEALRTELTRVLGNSGAVVSCIPLTSIQTADFDLALLDCSEDAVDSLREWIRDPQWRHGQIFGLVTVGIDPLDRQLLRPHLRMLLNKPVHHRTLLDILSRTWAKRKERQSAR